MVDQSRTASPRRVAAIVALAIAVLVSLFGVVLVIGSVTNDSAIEERTGRANADVVSVSTRRTLVRFQTPDGAEHVPAGGVLYPEALKEGQVVRVEYDQNNPDLVRVAGRNASLALLPVGTTLLGLWVVVGVGLWALRKRGPLNLRRPRVIRL